MAAQTSQVSMIVEETCFEHMFGDFPLTTEETRDALISNLFGLQLFEIDQESVRLGYLLDGMQIRRVTLEEANEFFKKEKKKPCEDAGEYKGRTRIYRQIYPDKLGFKPFEDLFLDGGAIIEKGTLAYHGTSREGALRLRSTGFQRDYETSYILTHGYGVYASIEREGAGCYVKEGGDILTVIFKERVVAAHVNPWIRFQNQLLETIKRKTKEKQPGLSPEESAKNYRHAIGLIGREIFERTGYRVFSTGTFYYITDPNLVSVVK